MRTDHGVPVPLRPAPLKRFPTIPAAAFVATLLALLIGGIVSFTNVQRLAENRRLVVHSYQVISGLDRVLTTIKDAETSQRGYLLTQDERHLDAYFEALGRVQRERNRLRVLVVDSADVALLSGELDPAINARLRSLANTLALLRTGNRVAALDAVRLGAGARLMDDVRRQASTIMRTEEERLSVRAADLDARSRYTTVLVVFTSLLGILLVGVVAILVRRRGLEQRLANSTIAIQAGQLQESLARVAENEKRLQLALQAANGVVWSWDPHTNTVDWDDQFHAQHGFANAEARTVDTWLRTVHPDDRDHILARKERLLAKSGDDTWNIEYRIQHPELGERWREGWGRAVLDDHGALLHFGGLEFDITERKQADATLQKWKSIFDHAGWAVATSASSGDVIDLVNPAFARMHGYTVEELHGQPTSLIIAPESVREIVPNAERANARGNNVFEDVHIRKDGSTFPCRSHVSAIYHADGTVAYRAATVEDITHQRAILDALRERERFIGRVLSASPGLVYIFDLDASRVEFINDRSRLPETPDSTMDDDARDRRLLDRLHPKDVSRLRNHLATVASLGDGEVASVEFRLRDGNNEWRTYFSRDMVFERNDQGGARLMLGVATDITERKQAHERERELLAAAAAATAKFHTLFEQGATFALILSVDGVVQDCNWLASEGCGHPLDQIIGIPFWEGPWWSPSPALVDRMRRGTEQAAAGTTFDDETSYFLGDGTQRHGVITILPIKDETGRVLFLAPTGMDITERKQLEAELRQLADELADANRRKDEFLATLAHELRNPLAPIRTGLHLLRNPMAEGTTETTRAMMERQVEQMVRLVDDLLDASRINRGNLTIHKARINLADALNQAIETSRPTISANEQTLFVELPPTPVLVDADVIRLGQVFANLLNNAAKYTHPQGEIRIIAESNGAHAVVRVRDNGDGIPADKLADIFELFSQVAQSTERGPSGLGIGLSLARQLVHLHDGTIVAQSEGLGAGSEFIVTLPLAASTAEEAPMVVEATPVAPQRRRILVADDNVDAASSLGMALELFGHDVMTVHDGLQAVAAAESYAPDLVLLDIGMPHLNGYDACMRIRAASWGATMTIVALTGWGQDDDRRQSQEAGFNHHLVKPVDFADLQKLLDARIEPVS